MSRRSLIGVLALTLVALVASFVVFVVSDGDFVTEAVPRAFGLLLQFWWWIVPTGIGVGLVLPRLASTNTPRAAAFRGSLVAVPLAVTFYVAVLLAKMFDGEFDVVFIEFNGQRIALDQPGPSALRLAVIALALAAPACGIASALLARRNQAATAV